MASAGFTLDDLKRVLLECAGVDESADLDGDILDTEFEQLGYDSLALLETAGRIERDHGISLGEAALSDARTPRALVATVNDCLASATAA